MRHEIMYFQASTFGAARIDDYKYIFIDNPDGVFGATIHLDVPLLVNLRLDPYERTIHFRETPSAQIDWYMHEFWRFTFVQKQVAKVAETFIEIPSQQAPASFNLEQVKAKIEEMRQKAKAGSVTN